ncbi:hypothetical protein DITRI_Ditri17bG0135800 [Diplodiscus trichospermus]
MAATSPPPKTSPPAVSPAFATNPPAPPPSTSSSSPPPTQNSPPPEPSTRATPSPSNANQPASQSPPPPSPPDVSGASPPVTSSPPSSAGTSPPPLTSPAPAPPPPSVSSTSPPSNSTSQPPPPTPPASPPPPAPRPSPGPTHSSAPSLAPSTQPPDTSPPASRQPPSSHPPQQLPSSPPSPPRQPPPSPPPPPRQPSSPPPPPPSSPPINSSSPPPANSPQPLQSPPTVPPTSPPLPSSVPPTPRSSQPTSSPSNSSSRSSPPPSVSRLSPPPRVSTPPSDNRTVDVSGPSAPESSDPAGNDGIGIAAAVAIGVTVGIIVLSLIGMAVWCLRKQKKKPTRLSGGYVMPSPLGSSPRSDSSFTKTHSSAPLIGGSSGSDFVHSQPVMPEPCGLGNSRLLFTYEELAKATNGFSDQNLLGEGGFGAVYKGCLLDGREVAVKQLKIGGEQGEREFKAEVEIISRIHHRHLVSLVGYCISEHRRLLIYDYVPNNTLYFHLHEEGRPVLDWPTRVKIAAGAARGIAYLHEDCHPRIIHRDIKSSNILLDNNFEAQVSDFGLAKLALDANTHVTTRVMGTFGYMAPEYASSGKLTEKSDVFSFGVVLLELITGRKPVDASQPLGDESLVEWARPLLSHALDSEDFEGLADPKLGRNYVESEMFRMIEAATACVRHSAAKRPRMGQVVRAFDSLATSDLTNGMRVGESELFNSAQQSEEIRWFRRMAFGSQNYSTDYFSGNSRDG